MLFILLNKVVLSFEFVYENPSNENYLHLKVLSLAQYFPVKLIITLYKVALSVECVDESVSSA